MSIIKAHTKSDKHTAEKEVLAKDKTEFERRKSKLLDYNAKVHPEGEGLPIEQQHAAARVRAPCGAVWRYVALCGDMGIMLRYVNNGIRSTQNNNSNR